MSLNTSTPVGSSLLERLPRYLVWLVYGTIVLIEFGLWLLYAHSSATLLEYAYARDFQGIYLGVRMVLDGHAGQLYDLAAQQQASDAIIAPYGPRLVPFYYPIYTVFYLLPLGLLPYTTAFVVWTVLNLLLVGGTLVWLARSGTPARGERLALFVTMLAAPPVFHTLWQGQISVLPLVSLTGLALALRRGQAVQAGAWGILGLIKPQLVVVPLLALLVARRWQAFLVTAGTGALLVGISLALFGNWLPGFNNLLRQSVIAGEAAAGYVVGMPNWQGLVYKLLGTSDSPPAVALSAGLILGSLALVVVLCWPRPRLGRATGEVRLALAVLLSVLIVPHMYIHDALILLVPGVLLWRASTAALTRAAIGRVHLLRWLLGSGPLAFHLMQFWHPPLLQIGAWYLVALILTVLWCWNVLDADPSPVPPPTALPT
jgi:hypothetical protein